MGNGAWGALGAAAVLATASSGCGHGAQRVGAQATAVVADADGDESGVVVLGDDAAEQLTGTPDAEGVPEATFDDDAGPVVEEAGGNGDENDQDVGSPSLGDDGSGSSSGGVVIIYIDSGSPAPPSQTVDASVESGAAPDSGSETPGPMQPEGGQVAGSPHRGLLGLRVLPPSVGDQGVPPGIGDDADVSVSGDDSSSPLDDAGSPWGGGWPSDDGGDPNLDLPPSKAIIGCAGCSVPDATSSGTLAWLMVALTAGVRALRRRGR
jgi:hypothetical protein